MNLWKRLRPIWLPFWNRRISLYASSACFYMILSLLPSAILILSLLFRFSITEENLISFLEAVLPTRFLSLFQYFEQTIPQTSTAAFSFSLFTLLWSASKGTLSIVEGLEATEVPKTQKGFFHRRLLGILYFLFLWGAITVMLIAHVFGQSILTLLLHSAEQISQLWQLLLRLRFLYTIGLLSVLFAWIYRVFPVNKAGRWHCLFSGLTVSAAWTLFSWLFSLYVNHFASHQRLYGGIGLLLLMVIWLHICIILILQGSVLCQLLDCGSYHPIRLLKSAFKPRKD